MLIQLIYNLSLICRFLTYLTKISVLDNNLQKIEEPDRVFQYSHVFQALSINELKGMTFTNSTPGETW